MNNSTNSSDGDNINTHFVKHALLYYAGIEIVITPVIIISNVVLIVSILYKRELRHEFRYLSIVSIAVSDLTIGILITPLKANVYFNGIFAHGCAAHVLSDVYEEYIHMYVSMWTMVNMNTDYILKMCNVRTPFLTPLRRRALFSVILALPWLTMLFVVLPIAYVYARIYIHKSYCFIYLSSPAYTLVASLAYMVPATVMLLQVVVMTVVCLYRRNRATRIPAIATAVAFPPPWVLVAASAVNVLFMFVEEIIILMVMNTMQLKMPRKIMLLLILTAEGSSDTKSAVLPFAWFFYSDIRASLCELFNKLSCRRTVDIFKSDFKVSYKEFSDKAPESCEISM